MKQLIPFLSLLAMSCSSQYTEHNETVKNYFSVEKPNHSLDISIPKPAFSPAENAASLIKRLQSHEYVKWQIEIQKIKDTYSRVIKVLEDKETIQFTVAFFKVLSMSEDLDRSTFALSEELNDLPNIDSLKYFYTAEKELDGMIAILAPFTNSTDNEVRRCAVETEKYFRYQKNLLAAVRDLDYLSLKMSDITMEIPPKVIKANAKLLEQRDQMSKCLISFYSNFANK